jgi:hypothetical protein
MIVGCRLTAGQVPAMLVQSTITRPLDCSDSQLLEKGRPVRLRAYQAGLWGCYIIPDGSVGLV